MVRTLRLESSVVVLTWQDPGPGNGEPEGVQVHVLEELHILLRNSLVSFSVAGFKILRQIIVGQQCR
jgi:hypothetical protein